MTQPYRFQLRRGTAAQWDAADPVLLAGEPGVALDTLQLRIGDGVSHWSELDSIGGADAVAAALAAEAVVRADSDDVLAAAIDAETLARNAAIAAEQAARTAADATLTTAVDELGWDYAWATADDSTSTRVTNRAHPQLIVPSALPNGLYELQAYVLGLTAVETSAVQIGIEFGASAPLRAIVNMSAATSVTDSPLYISGITPSAPGSSGTTQSLVGRLTGVFRATAMVHPLQLIYRPETEGILATISADSFLRWQRIAS